MTDVEVELDRLRVAHEATQARRPPVGRQRKGRALCLSGGGYRAALFHLGSLLRLHETDQLADVTLFSSVSGGSITSAWLACRYLASRSSPAETFPDWCRRVDFLKVVVEPFRDVVAVDLRTWPVLLTIAFNWLYPSKRVEMLQSAYAGVFGHLALNDLPDSPAFVFCATDVTFGVNWIFSKRRIGDYLAGYLRDPHAISLAVAVAASSSFPPVFGPIRFQAKSEDLHKGKYRGEDGDALRARINLSDGGVYDNLATEPSLRDYAQVLVSDAGAPFPFKAHRWFVRHLLRYTEVMGNQAEALRKRLFFLLRSNGDIDGAYWSLAGGARNKHPKPGYSQSLISEFIGQIRTDLDRFLPGEFSVLVNHGYFACVNALNQQTGWQSSVSAQWPYPALADEDLIKRVLRSSHRRFFHSRWWDRSRRGA